MKIFYKAALAASLLIIFTSPLPSPAAEEIGDQLSGSVKLSETEKAALEPALAQYYGLGGSSEPLKTLIESCGNCGCRDECMADLLGLATEAMRIGKKDVEATGDVLKALKSVKDYSRERGVEPTSAEISRAVKANLSKSPAPKVEGGQTPSPMVR